MAVKQAAKPAPKTTAVVSWDAELAARAAKSIKSVASMSTGNFIQTRGGVFSYLDNEVGSELTVLILDALLVNALYEGKYDPKNPQSPSCYAFGYTDDELAPHAEAPSPQAEACEGCPNNEFGSSGKGKACKNTVRLGLIGLGNDQLTSEGLEEADIAYLSVPPTSLKAWSGYVKQLNAAGLSHHRVMTTIKIAKFETYFKLDFKAGSRLDDDLMSDVVVKIKSCEAQIQFPYAVMEQAPPPAKGKRKF